MVIDILLIRIRKYHQCFPRYVEVEWTFAPVKGNELLDPASSLQDIHILHRGSAQIPTGHLSSNE
jgi:hypothetical protein